MTKVLTGWRLRQDRVRQLSWLLSALACRPSLRRELQPEGCLPILTT